MSNERTIFLCEDELRAYNGLEEILSLSGYRVSMGARTVAGALSIVHQLVETPVLAALIDKQFPDGDGDSIAQAINKLNLGIHTIGIGSAHKVIGVNINILKPEGPAPLLEYLNQLK